LSVRSPRNAGCRISDSLVHSVNFTSPTSFGISGVADLGERHCSDFAGLAFAALGFAWTM
jgi:hypothetical protein